ncbi:MAG: aminotransferase class I/II-fold pyridoxal phosphate-dependent enzyme [Candidatus Magasanikbacteria bacterium]|jgi:perosamine synthetase|nr:aminotransferase class I/II-fold pyridoxal phosphate-dependent enzyme [Candidatus Magasanikbacteria bacterium]MBT4071804.1 aminotransferase class I/II-fold pyridoxal phosphate-dependent enzyme [Candidatus Magasanikbacteria bacterium]
MIFTGFLPNTRSSDVRIALSYLLLPWKWFSIRKGKHIAEVEEKLQTYFQVSTAITFDSGRTALQKAIEVLDIKKGDEVIVQGYTCMVVSNAIRWTGATPVYVDVLEDLNMNTADLKKKITKNTKAIIIQHTFGNPAKVEEIVALAKEKNISTIEDTAHAIGGEYKGKKLGTFADIGMFSFGTDKVISCVRGGALITNNAEIAKKIKALHGELPQTSLLKVSQYLYNIPLFQIGKRGYSSFGKILLVASNKLHLTGKIIYKQEKCGAQISAYPATLPNALAHILLGQLDDLDARNVHRQTIAKQYKKALPDIETPHNHPENIFLRYTLFVSDPKSLLAYAKKHGILLGNWYNAPIAPAYKEAPITGYEKGMCPHAESYAARSMNLPTNRNIGKKEAETIINCVKSYENRSR